LKMKTACFSETFASTYETTRRQNSKTTPTSIWALLTKLVYLFLWWTCGRTVLCSVYKHYLCFVHFICWCTWFLRSSNFL
jgi:hypothetical protein